jgi:hypothetical protein
MGVLFGILLRLSIPILFACGIFYGVFRGIRYLENKYVLESGNSPLLIDEDAPEREAKLIAERIRKAIIRKRDAGGGLAQDFEKDVSIILDERFPRIRENQKRLNNYLNQIDSKAILDEPGRLSQRIRTCKDDELKDVLEKNLTLALERKDNLLHLETMKEKTEAQMNLIIMGLKNVEDKVESLRLAEGKIDSVSGALENVSKEVHNLEEEYREMNIHYDE